VRDVIHAAGDKIINANDLVAAGHQQVGQVRAEESGGAGDHGGWLCPFHFWRQNSGMPGGFNAETVSSGFF
jgi:hypothetical protein